jgi:kinesin family member 6/9
LLDADHSTKSLQDLPKVQPFENQGEQIFLKGLSVHKAKIEEDALNLLFIGDTNRPGGSRNAHERRIYAFTLYFHRAN